MTDPGTIVRDIPTSSFSASGSRPARGRAPTDTEWANAVARAIHLTGTTTELHADVMHGTTTLVAERRAPDTAGRLVKRAGWISVPPALLADPPAGLLEHLARGLWWNLTGLDKPTGDLLPTRRVRRRRWWRS